MSVCHTTAKCKVTFVQEHFVRDKERKSETKKDWPVPRLVCLPSVSWFRIFIWVCHTVRPVSFRIYGDVLMTSEDPFQLFSRRRAIQHVIKRKSKIMTPLHTDTPPAYAIQSNNPGKESTASFDSNLFFANHDIVDNGNTSMCSRHPFITTGSNCLSWSTGTTM